MPTRSRVFIDGLALTVPVVQRRDQERLVSWFRTERDFNLVNAYPQCGPPRSGMYLNSFWIPTGPRSECLVEMTPYRRGNFMRLEFNPSKTPRGLQRIIEIFSLALPGFSMRDVLGGQTSRIDISYDVYNIDLERFDTFGTLRRRQSRRFQTSRANDVRGRLNAIEIGSYESPSRLLVYDKRLERELAEGERLLYPRIMRSRIRIELRKRRWGRTRDVESAENEFLKYSLYEHDGVGGEAPQDLTQLFFRLAVRGLGAQAVLSQIANQRTRDRLRRSLVSAAPASYWQPHEVWAEFINEWRTLIAPG